MRKTEDIVDKEEGCQDLVRLCISRSRVVDDRAHCSSTAYGTHAARRARGDGRGRGRHDRDDRARRDKRDETTAPISTSGATSRPAHAPRPASPRPHRARRPSLARCPRPPPHRRVRFDTASAVPTSARWRSEANASGRPGGHTATVRAVSRLRLISVRHASKNFKNLLSFFNLVPVGSFCAALREKTSTWPKLM